MERPWAVLIPTLVILLGAGLPFLQADFSIASRDALPPDDETRIGLELMDDKWPNEAVNSAMVVFDFDGADPLSEENIRVMFKWMGEQVNDSRVINGFGYAFPPIENLTESAVVEFWTTPEENLTTEQIITREYLRSSFISNNVTYVVFSLSGPITSEDGRGFVYEVREDRKDLIWPASLYLEGTDQHRGWFHSSLLESCGTRGRAPFDSILSHGFVVDGKGLKMSKSLGNVIAPEDILKKYGADILRIWVASSNLSLIHI